MAITNIQVNFTPCDPAPVGGYNIEYRVVGDLSYIDAGNFMASPANIVVSYPDGTLFEGIVHSPCGDVVWSTVPVTTDGCGCRFAYPGEDDTAGETRSFDLNTFDFSITNGSNTYLKFFTSSEQAFLSAGKDAGLQSFDGTNVAVSEVKTDILGSGVWWESRTDIGGGINTSIRGDGLTESITIYAVNDIILGGFGTGAITGIPTFGLAVDAVGKVIEVPLDGGGGSGVDMFRFGFGGEDDTAGENRLFDVGIYTFTFQTTEVGGGALNLNAPNGVGLTSIGSMAGGLFDGNAGVGIQSESNSGDYGVDARSYIATDNTLVYPAIKCLSIAGILPTDVGFGTGINFEITTDTLPHSRNSNRIVSRWNNATEGSQTSEFYIAGVDGATDAILLSILGNGIFTLPLGLFEYADDTAAAAGTPPIPIGGLYRIGNTPQIRLT